MTETSRDRDGKTGRQSGSVSPRLLAGVVLTIMALIFVFQNAGNGRVTFLFWRVDAPAWTWLVLIFAVGVIVGLLVPRFRGRKRG